MKLTNKKGFTLIEIVIVLAIAALILIIVFLAVGGAQRSRRDTQRKADADRIKAQLDDYAGSHNSDYPLANNVGTALGSNAAGGFGQANINTVPTARTFIADYATVTGNPPTLRDPNGTAATTNGSVGYSFGTGTAAPVACATATGPNSIPTANATRAAGIYYQSGTTAGNNRTFTMRMCLESGEYVLNQ